MIKFIWDNRFPRFVFFFVGILIAIRLTFGPIETVCADGWHSLSIGHRGACSWHGGVGTSWTGVLRMLLAAIGAYAVTRLPKTKDSREPTPVSKSENAGIKVESNGEERASRPDADIGGAKPGDTNRQMVPNYFATYEPKPATAPDSDPEDGSTPEERSKQGEAATRAYLDQYFSAPRVNGKPEPYKPKTQKRATRKPTRRT